METLFRVTFLALADRCVAVRLVGGGSYDIRNLVRQLERGRLVFAT